MLIANLKMTFYYDVWGCRNPGAICGAPVLQKEKHRVSRAASLHS